MIRLAPTRNHDEIIFFRDVPDQYGVSLSWLYKKSKELESAKLRFAGKVLRPIRFKRIDLDKLFYSPSQNQNQRYDGGVSEVKKAFIKPEDLWR